jgi:hypothetical protein
MSKPNPNVAVYVGAAPNAINVPVNPPGHQPDAEDVLVLVRLGVAFAELAKIYSGDQALSGDLKEAGLKATRSAIAASKIGL